MNKLFAMATAACLSGAAHAGTILTTGAGDPAADSFALADQAIYGKFTLNSAAIVSDIESYFVNAGATPQAATATLYGNDADSDTPGLSLGSYSFNVPVQDGGQWAGIHGLSIALAPGSYWMAFSAPASSELSLLGGVASPLEAYGTNTGDGFITPNYNTALRLSSPDAPAEVPEPAMLGLFGLSALGLGLARRKAAALG